MRDDSIILSYHRFVEQESDYRFSRTYEQFSHDIRKKKYDLITIDDGMKCQIRACEMLTAEGIRAKLFTCTSLIGLPGYCTWEDMRELAKYHDIENHSHLHEWHDKMNQYEVADSIAMAQREIMRETAIRPKYFVAPYNKHTDATDVTCSIIGLIPLKNRINILNISK